MKTLGTLVVAVALAIGSISLVAAQYPPPGAAITFTPSNPAPGTGETISITVQVTAPTAFNTEDTSGRAILASMPAAPRDDADASFAAVQAPPYTCTSGVTGGSGATVSPRDVTTDANGVANLSLYTGTQAATLTVTVACGDVSAQALIPVGGGGGGGGGGGDGTPPGPPSTGTAANSDGGSNSTIWAATIAAGALVVGAGAFVVRRSRRDAIRS